MASNLPIAETVGMALTTLRANRLRSLLTMLGIIIGVSLLRYVISIKVSSLDVIGMLLIRLVISVLLYFF